MKIIITGATGFVGQNLSGYLQKNQFETQALSLRNSDWEQKIDKAAHTIVHLAGKAHDTKNTSDASEYFAVNTHLTQKLFDAFLESNIQDFFYFSSVKAVADSVEGILQEDVVPSAKTPYGESKLQAESYILSKVIPENKRVFIIRPCMIHGAGNKGNLNLLYNVVKKGIPYPLAAFDNERSFLSIENLNFLVFKMIENKNVASGVYHFADDEFVSTTNLVSLISKVTNKKVAMLKIPKGIINALASVGDVFRLPLNSEKIMKLTENYKVSNQKVKKALDISKLPLTALEGLEQTIKSFENK